MTSPHHAREHRTISAADAVGHVAHAWSRGPRSTISLALMMSVLYALALAIGCGPSVVAGDVMDDRARADVVTEAAADAPASDVVDPECRVNTDCDNGIYCDGEERCVGGQCRPAISPACDDGHSCTTDICDEAMRSCAHTPDDSMCGDMNACNGVERCDPSALGANAVTGCAPVRPDNLVDCDDGNNCTIDTCDPSAGCVHAPRDLDGDGHVDRACTIEGTPGGTPGDDCNDGDPAVFPGAPEICEDSRDNNCDGRTDYAESTCLPVNDTCATARRLPGPGVYWASTSGLANDYALGCNTGSYADAVFEFTTTTVQDVTIAISATGAAAAIALLSDCTGPEIRCNRGTTSSRPQIRVRSLPAGTYRVIAETGGTPAAFQLTLRYDPPTTPPPEDTCPAAGGTAIELNDGMPHTVMLSALEDDYTLSCRSFGAGRDGVFRLTLTAESDVTIRGTARSGTTYLSFRDSPCALDASERRCFSGSGIGTGATLTQRGLPPGTYWIIAENSTSPESDVTVQATVTPAAMRTPGDTCPGLPVMPGGPAVTVARSTLLMGSDVGTSCGTGTGTGSGFTDAVFQFTLTETRDVVLDATRTGTGTIYMQVFSACGARGSAIGACVSGSTAGATRRIASMAPGTYYVVVETNSASVTDMSLRVTATDPALRSPSESCPGQVIPTDGTITTVVWGGAGAPGSIGANPDVGTSCGSRGTSAAYRDVVLAYTLASTQDVTITIDGAGSPIYREVRSDCGTLTGVVSTCYSSSSSGVRRIRSQPPGTYYIVLETTASAPMPTRVSVSASAPTPVVTYTTSSPMGVTYTDACAETGHTTVLVSVDDSIVTAMAPFPIRLYGNDITTPWTISSNGYMAADTSGGAPLSGTIPSASSPNLTVAAYWRDLVTSAAGVCYVTRGTAPNRQWVIEWQNARHYGSTGEMLTFQIIFNEAPSGTNNTIDVVYQTMTGAGTATAGVENEDGSLGTTDPGPFTAPRVVRYTPSP